MAKAVRGNLGVYEQRKSIKSLLSKWSFTTDMRLSNLQYSL